MSFCQFYLAIVLSVLWFTDSDYPFRIFKLFLPKQIEKYSIYCVTFELFYCVTFELFYCVQHVFVSSKNCVRTCFWYTFVQLSSSMCVLRLYHDNLGSPLLYNVGSFFCTWQTIVIFQIMIFMFYKLISFKSLFI